MATFPVMAAVLIGLRAALFALGVTVLSLTGIGVAGCLEADAQGRISETGIGNVIVKPFAMKELEEIIRLAMARVEK